MTWRIVIINKHSKLSYQNNALIFRYDEGIEKIHLSEIHTIVAETTDIVITTALIAKIVKYKIKLIFCDEAKLPIAELIPYYGSHDTSRSVANQINWDKEIQKIIWTKIIAQKINNQASHLLSHDKVKEYDRLKKYLSMLVIFDETNREGHAAKVYFNTLFGKDFTRDTQNDVNAALNYGYTLLLSVFSREIVKNGCITQLGLKHSNYFNQFNLASDLMEPFRPLIDKIVFEHQKLEFSKIKYQLFKLFSDTYYFEGKQMYFVNIVEIFVKKILICLNESKVEFPEFNFTWEK